MVLLDGGEGPYFLTNRHGLAAPPTLLPDVGGTPCRSGTATRVAGAWGGEERDKGLVQGWGEEAEFLWGAGVSRGCSSASFCLRCIVRWSSSRVMAAASVNCSDTTWSTIRPSSSDSPSCKHLIINMKHCSVVIEQTRHSVLPQLWRQSLESLDSGLLDHFWDCGCNCQSWTWILKSVDPKKESSESQRKILMRQGSSLKGTLMGLTVMASGLDPAYKHKKWC